MAQLVPITLEDGSEIYIEADGAVNPDLAAQCDDEEETVRGGQKGWGGNGGSRGFTGMPGQADSPSRSGTAIAAAQSFKALEGTIRTYTSQTMRAFKEMPDSHNIDKVTLQFGIRIGAEAGLPYVTKGLAESNLSVTVECSFNKQEKS